MNTTSNRLTATLEAFALDVRGSAARRPDSNGGRQRSLPYLRAEQLMTGIRGVAVRLALIAGLAVVAVLTTTAPSSAYSPGYWGYPGGTTTPRIQAYRISSDFGQISFPARTVSKSSAYAAYKQEVCVSSNVVYAQSAYATSWSQKSSAQWCGWLTTNNTLTVPATLDSVYTSFIYAGNVRIDWYLSNGARIGTTVQDFNNVGDYGCSGCAVSSTNSLGAYVRF